MNKEEKMFDKKNMIDELFVEYFGKPLELTDMGFKVRILRPDVHCNGCEEKINKYDIAFVSVDHYVYHKTCRKKKEVAEL